MKKIFYILFALPFLSFAQSEYKVSSYLTEGFKAPNTHYIGEAWLNGVLSADEELPYGITKATFKQIQP